MSALNLTISVPYVPPTYIGGGETYIYYLSRALANLGVNISLFTAKMPQWKGDWNWSHVNLYECNSLFKVGNTPIMPTLPLQMLRNNHIDLIHTAVPSGFACDVSALISNIKRKPLVILYHCDVISSTITAKAYSSFLRLCTLRYTDRIISTTRSYAETSATLKHFADKVRIVPMGVDTTRFYVNEQYKDGIKKRHKIGDDKIILFVGGLNWPHKFKRVDLLIKAMVKVSEKRDDSTLIIAGEGELRPSLERLCQELKLKKVIFTGYVSNEELPKYCNAADLFALPSLTREEAFGIVLVESASCGAVPVCFDVPGPSEVCRDLGGFVVPLPTTAETYEDLAQTILHALATDLPSQSKICQRNAQKYAWSEVAQKTMEVYQELI